MTQDTRPVPVPSEPDTELARKRNRKAAAAIQLRAEGYGWEEVAETLGYPDAHRAQVAVELALEKQLKSPESQQFMRAVATNRLDMLLRSVWDKATDADHPEHLFAVDRAAKLIAQHTKLHGYEAPAEMVIHSPSTPEIERWVSEIVSVAQPSLEEADIFSDTVDGEVVPDAVVSTSSAYTGDSSSDRRE